MLGAVILSFGLLALAMLNLLCAPLTMLATGCGFLKAGEIVGKPLQNWVFSLSDRPG